MASKDNYQYYSLPFFSLEQSLICQVTVQLDMGVLASPVEGVADLLVLEDREVMVVVDLGVVVAEGQEEAVIVVVVVVTDKVSVEDLEVKRDREVVEVVILVTLVKPSLGLLVRTIPSMRKCLTLDSPAMARSKVESMRTQEQSVR